MRRLALLLAVLLSPTFAWAAPIPWKRLEYGKKLSAPKRAVAAAAMQTIKSYYGCKDAIAACLKRRTKKTTIAWRLADYISFLAGRGLDLAAITKIVARRRESTVGKKHYKIDLRGWPSKGSPRAPVVIVEFADFRCTHCAKVSPLLSALVAEFKGKVVLYFKPYPLKPYGASLLTAQAALAAQRQRKFWPLHDLLFENRDKHDRAGLRELAKKAGLDLVGFAAAMTDKQILKRIERSKIEGLRNGIRGTPTIYFNGRAFRLRKDAMHLRQRIEDELHILGR